MEDNLHPMQQQLDVALRSAFRSPKALAHKSHPGDVGMENVTVVFWADMFLVFILALCTLLQSPRIYARLSNPSERRNGHFLFRAPQPKPPSASASSSSQGSDTSQTGLVPVYAANEKASRCSPPKHVRAWEALLRPAIPFLRTPFVERIHLGGTMFCAFYFGVLLFAALYRTNVFTNPLRAGYVAVSQIPWVVVLASKNNIISLLLGIGWDHMNYIHRFAGRLLTIAANIHVLGYVYKWTISGSFVRHISQPRYAWGVIAIACIDILFFFSLAIWRLRAYNVFYLSHVAAFVLFLVAICLHMRAAIPWVLAAAGVYLVDLTLRCLKTRLCTAHLAPLSELRATAVEIPALTAGWRAGQHVRLRVLSRRMGWLGWAETHPFTIASAGGGITQRGLVLLCKNAGRWTTRLQALSREEHMDGSGTAVTVMVEGPYGGPGDTLLASFSGVLLVVGGSGISYGLAATEELVRKATEGASAVAVLDLVWCVRYSDCLTPMLPILTSLLAQAQAAGLAFQVTVFHTRAALPARTCGAYEIPAGLTLLTGHPSIPARLRDLVSRTQQGILDVGAEAGEGLRGVLVGVCGPMQLGEDVRAAIDTVEPDMQCAVGGMELIEEIYSL